MKSVAGKIIFAALSVLYPGLVFCGLYFWGLKPRVLSLALLVLALFHFISYSKENDKKSVSAIKGGLFFILTLLCGSIAFALDSTLFLMFYPVVISVCLLFFFGTSLFFGPNIIFRFACIGHKELSKSALRSYVERYCAKVTKVWCIFFIINGTIATGTAIYGNEKIWTIYNGCIAYILIGCLFAGEFMIRRIAERNQPPYMYLSSFKRDSRSDDSIVAFGGNGERDVKTWKDFTSDVSKLRQGFEKMENKPWILNFNDSYFFMVAFLALMQSHRTAIITANRSNEFIKEIRKEDSFFLTDEEFNGAILIDQFLKNNEDDGKWPTFNPSESNVFLYTSGTTGTPKKSPKKFIQLEDEVNEYASIYLEKYDKAVVIRTVNHHHIFGLTFSLMMSLMSASPFRRTMVEFPAEIESLKNNKLVIIASPAFLKRLSGGIDKPIDFKQNPFILSAGGVLPEDTAANAEKLLGYWPSEIYGSTETGCIAHRQSKIDVHYTPFPNNSVTLTDEGSLHVSSPYIYEKNGFTTADLIKQENDGRFVLLGRADSIVKIEEKRISLPEVEMRIRQTGFVQDVRVIALSKKRQFLAVAIVLNKEGSEKFKEYTKLEINQYFREFLANYLEMTVIPKKWRYLEELPQDTQGKIKNNDIEALFMYPDSTNKRILQVKRDGNHATIKFSIPQTSDYFNGHFEEFQLLPAVVQVELTMKFAHQFLGTTLSLKKILRTKFMKPILPEAQVFLELDFDSETSKLSFQFLGNDNEIHSSGSILLNEETK